MARCPIRGRNHEASRTSALPGHPPSVERHWMMSLAVLLSRAVFAAVVAIAPTEVDAWRLDPSPPPAMLLPVGESVVALWSRDG